MTRHVSTMLAAIAALSLALGSISAIVTVPVAQAASPAPTLAMTELA